MRMRVCTHVYMWGKFEKPIKTHMCKAKSWKI